jgi:hypothetical protein
VGSVSLVPAIFTSVKPLVGSVSMFLLTIFTSVNPLAGFVSLVPADYLHQCKSACGLR